MRKAIVQLMALSRNVVRNVRSGKKKVSLANAASQKTDYGGGAKSASVSINADVTGEIGGL